MFTIYKQKDKVSIKEISRITELLLLSLKCWQLRIGENVCPREQTGSRTEQLHVAGYGS